MRTKLLIGCLVTCMALACGGAKKDANSPEAEPSPSPPPSPSPVASEERIREICETGGGCYLREEFAGSEPTDEDVKLAVDGCMTTFSSAAPDVQQAMLECTNRCADDCRAVWDCVEKGPDVNCEPEGE